MRWFFYCRVRPWRIGEPIRGEYFLYEWRAFPFHRVRIHYYYIPYLLQSAHMNETPQTKPPADHPGDPQPPKNRLIKDQPASSGATKKPLAKNVLTWAIGGIAIIALILIAAFVAFNQEEPTSPDADVVEPTESESEKSAYEPSGTYAPSFARYEAIPVTASPSVPMYSVDEDLGNVSNADGFGFSDEAKRLLVENAFVVEPGYAREFYQVYESNRYESIPNFVTTDSMLHNYHLVFDHILKTLEEERFAGALKALNASMLRAAVSQYEALKGTEWENAAKRNAAFFTVGSKLLDPSVTIPDFVTGEVERELDLIAAHEGIAESPIMNIGSLRGDVYTSPQGLLGLDAYKEDYSQYVPRGHYTKTDQLKAYFKSMMWYGRMTFRLKSDDEIRSAILITLALDEGENSVGWNSLYEPINFFVGKSDDITYYQFEDLLDHAYGKSPTVQTVSRDGDAFDTFVSLTEDLEPPQINSIPIFTAEIQPDREREIKGFRYMGQRFTIDASIFQRLIDREVPKRMLPKGLDIPAAFGSEEALNILTKMGETSYENYAENLSKVRTYLSNESLETWTQNLYWGWMHALRPLTQEKSDGYPSFMQNLAWVRKELNTFLGSWTELKHDTILYAKQAYAELGGMPMEEGDDNGYVEPNPHVYGRLASLLRMTKDGLASRELLSDDMEENLSRMEQLALSLKTISEKELNDEAITDDDYELIRSYGGQLEHFWLEVHRKEINEAQSSPMTFLQDNPAALVADVATDPNGWVLEEAIGHISDIFVVIPVEGGLRIAKGGVFSYYEFTQPLKDRLTDEKWREMLDDGEAPPPPDWTSAFVAP